MEPTPRPLTCEYVAVTEIEKIEERFTTFDRITHSTGWWLVLKGFPDAIWFGPEQPYWDTARTAPFTVGDKLKLTFNRITN